MAGNRVYVQGNYVDVHDNDTVNLNIDKATVSVTEKNSELFDSRLKSDLIETDLADLLNSKEYITVATEWYVVLKVFTEKSWTKASQKDFVKWVQEKFPNMHPPKDANSLRSCQRNELNGIDSTEYYPKGPYRDLADALKNQFFGKLKENNNYEFEEKYLKFHQNPRTK